MRTNGTVWGKIVKALNKHDSLFLRVSVLHSPHKLPEQVHTESGTAGSMSIPGIPKPGCLLRGEPLERHSFIASGGVRGAGAVGCSSQECGTLARRQDLDSWAVLGRTAKAKQDLIRGTMTFVLCGMSQG